MFKMQGKKAKHIHISEGMSLYTRDRSPFYWGYINIDVEIFKKSLKTDDKEEAIKLLTLWKDEILEGGKKILAQKISIPAKKTLISNTAKVLAGVALLRVACDFLKILVVIRILRVQHQKILLI